MAADLRTIGASLKIITYLDRIGRYGLDIARVEQTLRAEEAQHAKKGHPRKPVAFQVMAENAVQMLDQALDAYRKRDEAAARSVGKQDDIVDGLEDEIFRQCVTYMMEDPRTITACSHYILVARHLERAADNASKIAEKVLYMVTGERRLKV